MSAPARADAASSGGRAVLDVTLISLAVERAALAAQLATYPGLALSGDAGLDTHPLLIELWHVREGRPQLAGIDQRVLSEAGGSAAGALAAGSLGAFVGGGTGASVGALAGGLSGLALGPVFVALGAAGGSIAGGASGCLAGAIPAAAAGAALGGRGAAGASRAASELGGRYCELMLSVPEVTLRGHADQRFTFVLGMYADSRFARWVDRKFAYGYRKRAARFRAAAPFRSYQVSDDCGRALLRARPQHPLDAATGVQPRELPAYPQLLRWARRPLLGWLGGDRYARSRLARDLDSAGIVAQPTAVELTLSESLSCLAAIAPPRLHVPPLTTDAFGCVQLARVPVFVSYPEAIATSSELGT